MTKSSVRVTEAIEEVLRKNEVLSELQTFHPGKEISQKQPNKNNKSPKGKKKTQLQPGGGGASL